MKRNLRTFFWTFYAPYKINICLFLLSSSWLGAYGLINSYLTKVLIDCFTSGQDANIHTRLFLPSVFLILNIMMLNVSWRIVGFIKLKIAPVVKNDMIHFLMDHVLAHSRKYFEDSLSGTISNNITLLVDSMERISMILSVRIWKGFVQWGFALCLMAFVHPIFAMGLLGWTIVFSLLSWRFSKKLQAYGDLYAKRHSSVVGEIVDVISNALGVLLFSGKTYEATRRQAFLDDLKQTYQKKEWFLMTFNFWQGTSIALLIGFMVYWLITLKLGGHVTLGDFALILGSTLYVTETVWTLLEQLDEINELVGRAKHSLKSLLKPVGMKDSLKPISIKKGSIRFKAISFQYDAPLFNDLTLKIPSKQKVGIVGYSGAGKSTFIKLILRLHDVDQGEILIDGQDIKNISIESLKKQITLIPQEPLIFHRTIFDNIHYGNVDATREEVIEATKKASLHERIQRLPQQYDTLIGEKGFKLSSGECQRIGLARAFLKQTPILILDEPTSQLDAVTEEAIERSLSILMRDKTTIVVAHRLSNLTKMDRILVFDQGHVVEDGRPQDLYKKGGAFTRFWDLQTGGTPYG